MVSSSTGTSGRNIFTASGIVVRIVWITDSTLPPAKGRRPVSISYVTTPSDQRSARASTGCPTACSGDM